MPSGGQLGSGVRAGIALNSPHSWTQIPEIRDTPQLPNRNRDRVESTVHGATSERSYIPGLAEVDDFQIVVRANLDDGSVHRTLKDYEQTQVTIWVRIEIPISSDLTTTEYFIYMQQMRVSRWNMLTPIDDLKEIEIDFVYEGSQFFMKGATAF